MTHLRRLKYTIILLLNHYELYQKKPFGTWQFGKIGVLVNLIIQKWKSKYLVSEICHVTQNLGFWFQCRKCGPWWLLFICTRFLYSLPGTWFLVYFKSEFYRLQQAKKLFQTRKITQFIKIYGSMVNLWVCLYLCSLIWINISLENT